MSDISFADVDDVDSPIADALLGTPLFAWSGRTGDALSCNLEALLPIRGDADGGGIGVGVDPRSVNERETELARESAGVDTEATNDPERDIDKDDIGRRSRGGEGAGCHPKRATMNEVSDNLAAGGGALSSACIAEGSSEGGVGTVAVDTAERRELSCEDVSGCLMAILDMIESRATAVILKSRAVKLGV